MRDQAGSVITGLVHTTTAQELDMRRQRFTHPVLAVAVNNSGRSPTSIQNVSILFDNGAAYSESRLDPALPFRLDAESEQTWFFDRGQIVTYAQAMGKVFSGPNPLVIRACAYTAATMSRPSRRTVWTCGRPSNARFMSSAVVVQLTETASWLTDASAVVAAFGAAVARSHRHDCDDARTCFGLGKSISSNAQPDLLCAEPRAR
jgi:hypothetical protein